MGTSTKTKPAVKKKVEPKKKEDAKITLLHSSSWDLNLTASDVSIIWAMSETVQGAGGAQIDAIARLREKVRPLVEEVRRLSAD